MTLKLKLNELKRYDFMTDDEQSGGIKAMMSLLNSDKYRKYLEKELERIKLSDGETAEAFARLSWERDQLRSNGKKYGQRWSQVTISVCKGVYSRSPEAYRALEDCKIFSLPSVRQLQRIIKREYNESYESMFAKF